MKDKKLLEKSVFEQLRELYYNKLQTLIDNRLKQLKEERKKLLNELNKDSEIRNIDEEYRNLKLINLVRYQDNSEQGEFTKHILKQIDQIIRQEESLFEVEGESENSNARIREKKIL